MKKYLFMPLFFVLVISCGGTPNVTDITGVEWKLVQVQVDGRDNNFDRNTLSKENAGKIFSLNFDAENISGIGAPNTYSAPYTRENENITINLLRTTLMASIWQPEKLREHDYFVYMQNAYKWNIADKKLELFTKDETGKEVKLVFSP